jgi:hypothetical protein
MVTDPPHRATGFSALLKPYLCRCDTEPGCRCGVAWLCGRDRQAHHAKLCKYSSVSRAADCKSSVAPELKRNCQLTASAASNFSRRVFRTDHLSVCLKSEKWCCPGPAPESASPPVKPSRSSCLSGGVAQREGILQCPLCQFTEEPMSSAVLLSDCREPRRPMPCSHCNSATFIPGLCGVPRLEDILSKRLNSCRSRSPTSDAV